VLVISTITAVLWVGLQLFGTTGTIERRPGGVERINIDRDT
jgi:hypothetical protein